MGGWGSGRRGPGGKGRGYGQLFKDKEKEEEKCGERARRGAKVGGGKRESMRGGTTTLAWGGGQNRREWKGRKENRNTRRGMGTIYTKTCEFVKENVNMGERREWNTKVKIGIVVREKCKS